MKSGRIRATIVSGDADGNGIRVVIVLGIFHENIPVTVLFEGVSVQYLVLVNVSTTIGALSNELLVRIWPLWILVKILHVRMRRRGIKIVIQLLDILSVIALMTSDTKEPLLQNGVYSIPKSQRKAQVLMIVADAGQAIFTPAICTGSCLRMRKMGPGIAIVGVIFTDRSLIWN
jgi:hypothetical protein